MNIKAIVKNSLRKLHYFASSFGHILWVDDEIKKLDYGIAILKSMEYGLTFNEAEGLVKRNENKSRF